MVLLRAVVDLKQVQRDVGAVTLTSYTFDRAELAELLAQVAKLIPTTSVMDWDSVLVAGRGCADQRSCAATMVSRGVSVLLTRGTGTSAHYAAVGRTASFRGIQHSKSLVVGSLMIHGSSN